MKAPNLNEKISEEIPERVAKSLSKASGNISKLIEESLETEKRLVNAERKNKLLALEKLKFIKSIKTKLRNKRNKKNKELDIEVKKIAKHYADEIHTNFNRFLYLLLQRISPVILNFMLNSFSAVQFFKNFRGTRELKNRIILRGNIELIRSLQKFGSLVLVPTHVSNFDSIVLGHMIHRAGLNPPLWGAGLNLFKGFTISHIMNNVGCYKVDRRKKNKIYLETLKEYSAYHLEKGYNTLFYPSGTRSRSGAIEQKLKLGLLGTVVNAFINNIKTGRTKSNIYVVPIALSYTVVPEAEELALDHFFGTTKRKRILKLSRKATMLGRAIKIIWNNFMRDNPIYMTFGSPIDPFGNKVNYEGVSIDENGIPINVSNMIKDENGNIIDDSKIKRNFTKILAEKISYDFQKINVIMPNQVFLYSMVNYFKKKHPDLSDEELVRIKPGENSIKENELMAEISKTIQMIKEKAPERNLDPLVEKEDVEGIFRHGVEIYTSNYAANAILKKGNTIIPNKIATILYYSSRIRCYFN